VTSLEASRRLSAEQPQQPQPAPAAAVPSFEAYLQRAKERKQATVGGLVAADSYSDLTDVSVEFDEHRSSSNGSDF
jgi:hypothetical protein